MSLHLVQLKVMAVGCGVVDLCGSESTILIASVVLFVVAYKHNMYRLLLMREGCISCTARAYDVITDL